MAEEERSTRDPDNTPNEQGLEYLSNLRNRLLDVYEESLTLGIEDLTNIPYTMSEESEGEFDDEGMGSGL